MPPSPAPTSSNMFKEYEPSLHPHLKGENKSESVVMSTHDDMFAGLDTKELVEQLRTTEALHEQADIIHYLFITK